MAYNDNVKQTPAGFLKLISIIHLALLGGQMVFGIVAFAQSTKMYFDIKNNGDPFIFIAPLLAIGGIVAGNLIFKQLLIALESKVSLSEKMMGYQTALIIRFALLEGPSLFGIVAYMISGNLFFLAITVMLMLYFLSLRPTKDKMENDLNLGFEEKMDFLFEDEAIK